MARKSNNFIFKKSRNFPVLTYFLFLHRNLGFFFRNFEIFKTILSNLKREWNWRSLRKKNHRNRINVSGNCALLRVEKWKICIYDFRNHILIKFWFRNIHFIIFLAFVYELKPWKKKSYTLLFWLFLHFFSNRKKIQVRNEKVYPQL